jgi:pimeloyl-ACP methyl ester carboxylesterase/DNA-binding CsgD family transcriptional regulator
VLSGDAHLAYQVFGDGDLDLLLLPPGWGHLDLRWEWPGYAQLLLALGSFARVITLDKRGTGMSDRSEFGGLEDQVRDAAAVLDASGSRSAVLLGVCDGGLVALQLALTHPERIAGVAVYATPVRISPLAELGLSVDLDRLVAVAGAGWDAGALVPVLGPSVAGDPDFRSWWERYTRASISPDGVRMMARAWRDVDLAPVLPSLDAPALVLHRTGDRFVPVANGREIARLVHGATYKELPGDDYFAWVGDVEALVAEVRAFARADHPPAAASRLAVAVAVAPVAGNRGQDWSPQGELHDRLAARARTADAHLVVGPAGVAAVFDVVAPALDAAAALLEDAARHSIRASVGVHLGEAPAAGDLRRAACVTGAADLAAEPAPGTALVSRPAADLSTSHSFHSHGPVRVGGRQVEVLELDQAGRRSAAQLTPREQRVLDLLAEGLANKQIARRLGISDKTVKNHVTAVLAKLGVADRTSAALLAVRGGHESDPFRSS